jgi:uncharacterized protein
MVVGMLRIVLAIPESRSLKDKRQVVRKVLDKARAKFHVAAAEVGMLDAHRYAELGFAVVSNDARHAQSMIDHVGALVAGATEALVHERSFVIEHRNDLAESARDLSGHLDTASGVEYDAPSSADAEDDEP